MTPDLADITADIERDLSCIRAWGQSGGLEAVADAVVRLWHGQTWKARGYATWGAMFAAEIGDALRLGRRNRQRMHARLTAAGMTTRAVAVVTGVSVGTVHDDKSGDCSITEQSPLSPSDESPAAAATVAVGLDGARRITDPVASKALTERIVELRAQGWSYPRIGAEVGLTSSAAHNRMSCHRRKAAAKPAPAAPSDAKVSTLPTSARITELAGTGMTSMQIAHELGIGQERVRELAHRDDIRLVGDINRGFGGVKTIDMQKAVGRWIAQLAATFDAADSFMDLAELTPDEAAEWAHQLNQIDKRFRALTRKFQQQSNQRQAQHG